MIKENGPSTRPSLLIRLQDSADQRAWSEFVEIYQTLLCRIAKGWGLQQADADDLVQDVLWIVSKAIDEGRFDPSRGSFRGWLFRIARNLTLKTMLARKRQVRGTGDSRIQTLLEDQPAPAPESTAEFESAYRRRVLEWAARRVQPELSETAWLAFAGTAMESRPALEVAHQLGIKVGTVYNLKCQVMARLRTEIAALEDSGLDDFHQESQP